MPPAPDGASARRRLARGVKRLIDVVVATIGLVLLSPVLIVIGVAIARKLGKPVLFGQRRPGLHGEPFTLLKFRTMRDLRDADGRLLSDAERLTSFGLLLRRASLDELTSLWNVLRGDMSLVGPRPLLIEYLDRYTPEQARRHEVRPGITGLAQISGRNAVPWDEKFVLDVRYVDHWSLWLDLRILRRTLVKVLRRDGISGAGEVTMSQFRGSPPPQTPR